MNSYILHIYLIFFIFLSNTYLIVDFDLLDVIIGGHIGMDFIVVTIHTEIPLLALR